MKSVLDPKLLENKERREIKERHLNFSLLCTGERDPNDGSPKICKKLAKAVWGPTTKHRFPNGDRGQTRTIHCLKCNKRGTLDYATHDRDGQELTWVPVTYFEKGPTDGKGKGKGKGKGTDHAQPPGRHTQKRAGHQQTTRRVSTRHGRAE